MGKIRIAPSSYQPGRLLPAYLTSILYHILKETGKPIDISQLIEQAIKQTGDNSIEFIEKKLYVLAKIKTSHFYVHAYPSFKLHKTHRFPNFEGVTDGIKYLLSASKILISSVDYVDVRKLVSTVEQKRLFKFPTSVPEYWMYVRLRAHKDIFQQRGALDIALKEWNMNLPLFSEVEADKKLKTTQTDDDTNHLTRNIHEANVESLLFENLGLLEEGLQPIKRQFHCPGVGRIDILCRDCNSNLVVVELKKYGVRHDSVLDQILRYMGYLKEHVAEGSQIVRGIIVVGKVDEKLRYAVSAVPNIAVKTFDLTIK